MIQMKVSAQEAERELSLIEHEKFQQGFSKYWKYKTGTAQATAQSICWLYCWAAAERGSYKGQENWQEKRSTIFRSSQCLRLAPSTAALLH